MVQTHINDQPEKFEDKGRTIYWVGGHLKKYVAAWHEQWERQALNRKFPRSGVIYQNDITLIFEDKEAQDEAYASMEKSDMRETSKICSPKSRCIMIRLS